MISHHTKRFNKLDMRSSKKTLKMERLSPIPPVDRNLLLSHSMGECTPNQPAMPPSHRRQKDMYAIETTSSPEFGEMPAAACSSSLQKQRRYRNIARGKVSRKPKSMPLSGFISRKTASPTPSETRHFSDLFSSPTSIGTASPCREPLTSISEEQPLIDDYSPQKPSPSLHHTEIISVATVFPKRSVPNTSTTPLAGLVNRKDSSLNLSLNDSIVVLQNAEDYSDDEGMVSNTSLPNLCSKHQVEKVCIESFESPQKPRFMIPKELTSSASISQNFRPNPKKPCKDHLNQAILPSPGMVISSKSEEMCGNERKNRKRALDFNTSTFLDPIPSDEVEQDRRSPMLRFLSPGGDFAEVPGHERDSPSPILNLDSPKSPILDVVPLCGQSDEALHSPVTSSMSPFNHQFDCQSPISNLEPLKSPVLNISYPSSREAHVQPINACMIFENNPSTENQEDNCPSDSDSVIESTPKQMKNRNLCSGGFIASSRFNTASDSLHSTEIKIDYSRDELEFPKIVEILEETSDDKNSCDRGLKFVVVSHDSSSDEADEEKATKNDCDVFQTIDGGDSPHSEMNYTKRPILSFESPSKASKPFSEAVDIGAFGSPDSSASHHDHQCEQEEQELGTDEAIEPSTTQEFVEESEKVRPTKRRKKGSLLDRVRGVIGKVDASSALFDYEMKCGLRPTKGNLVSAPLAILKKFGEASSLFLVCKPLKYCGSSSHVEDSSSFVAVHVNKLPPGVCEGSAVLLHFPLHALYFSDLSIPCVLAGHRVAPYLTEPKIDVGKIDTSTLDSIRSFSLVYNKPNTSFRSFSSVKMRTLTEAALCQTLVEENTLYLTVMHLTKLYVGDILKKISVLCCDEELQYCWLEFSSERDIKRAVALETLKVLSDGVQVQTKGFSVVERVRLDRKSKNLICYCSNNPVSNEIIFAVHPKESNWVISSTDGLSEVKKVPSSISDILSSKVLGRRYFIEVHGVEKESENIVKDSQGQSIHLVIGGNSNITLHHPVPFFLDGVYFYDGRLFSDEHTRVVLKH